MGLFMSEFISRFTDIELSKLVLMALIGGISSLLSNRGLAVFNDGLRPLISEYIEGKMNRKILAVNTFALSFGLIIGFGIPFSLLSSIILVHSLLLGTDVIGIWCANSRRGSICASLIGSLYGIALLVGLKSIVNLFAILPINFMEQLSKVGAPIIVCFSLFPSLVTAYQYSYGKGLLVLIITLISYLITENFGILSFDRYSQMSVKLDPNGMALLFAMIGMFYFAMCEKRPQHSETAAILRDKSVGLFSERIKRIQKNRGLFILNGGLTSVAATTSMCLLAESPMSLQLLANGETTGAILVALARAISFIPLIGTTAIATGIYSPDGMKFTFVVGLFTQNPIIAFIMGGIVIAIEIILLSKLAVWLDNYPGVKACGEYIRIAIMHMLEFTLLVGGMMASNAILPSLGFMIVAGIYLLNRSAKFPLNNMAIGPIATIIVGIFANIICILGLK